MTRIVYEWTIVDPTHGEHQATTSMREFKKLLAEAGFTSLGEALEDDEWLVQLRRVGPGTIAEADAILVDGQWCLNEDMIDWCGGVYKTPARLIQQFAKQVEVTS